MPKSRKRATRPPLAHEIFESDLAQDITGRNSLQGNDQQNVHNERRAVPNERGEADDLLETYEKSDKDIRAKRDLGKGRRHSPEHPYNRPEEPEGE